MLFPTLGPTSLPVVMAQPDETCKQNSFCVGSDMTDTEHSTTSGSNEVAILEGGARTG